MVLKINQRGHFVLKKRKEEKENTGSERERERVGERKDI